MRRTADESAVFASETCRRTCACLFACVLRKNCLLSRSRSTLSAPSSVITASVPCCAAVTASTTVQTYSSCICWMRMTPGSPIGILSKGSAQMVCAPPQLDASPGWDCSEATPGQHQHATALAHAPTHTTECNMKVQHLRRRDATTPSTRACHSSTTPGLSGAGLTCLGAGLGHILVLDQQEQGAQALAVLLVHQQLLIHVRVVDLHSRGTLWSSKTQALAYTERNAHCIHSKACLISCTHRFSRQPYFEHVRLHGCQALRGHGDVLI